MINNQSLVKLLILVTVIVNGYGLFSPILASNDANFYSVIAKNIVDSNNWVNLTFAGSDWLDKPHLPMWLTAISYKIFGITTFAYILPGMLFHLLGGYYTYRLAKYLYKDNNIGLLASLIYFSSFRLMLSSVDVRAEAFLLGEIMPACYYWLYYNDNEQIKLKQLILGALFTAMALMTKGLFTLLIITSGVVAIWFYEKRVVNFIKPKWLLALLLSFIFALPEFISLYLQFDLHPEKLVFGEYNVSGLKFFFWDSQFGRFFDNGPITSGKAPQDVSHYFFFIHTFLWAFLPWSLIFLFGLFGSIRGLIVGEEDRLYTKNTLYLTFSILPTFVLFSLTKFQLDHYINILIPFASILCSFWLIKLIIYTKNSYRIWCLQIGLVITLLSILTICGIWFLISFNSLIFFTLATTFILVIIIFSLLKHKNWNLALIISIITSNLLFLFVMQVNNGIYAKYAAGYNVASFLENKPKLTILDKVYLTSLEFRVQTPYRRINNFDEFKKQKNSEYYLLIRDHDKKLLENLNIKANLLDTFYYIPQNSFVQTLFNNDNLLQTRQILLLYRVDT